MPPSRRVTGNGLSWPRTRRSCRPRPLPPARTARLTELLSKVKKPAAIVEPALARGSRANVSAHSKDTRQSRFGREGNGESLGQLGGASLSNCRELRAEGDQREAWLQPLRKHRFASNGNCIAGNQCVRSGLSTKLLSNPFESVVAYPEALFRRDLSRRSPKHSDRR